MALQYSEAVRNARLNSDETVIGASAKLYIRSGAQPANCAAADAGTLLATLDLPADWQSAASGGAATKNGTWSGSVGTSGNAGHFRIKDSTGTNTGIQGSVSELAGGGDLVLQQATVALVSGQTVTVSVFTRTAAGA